MASPAVSARRQSTRLPQYLALLYGLMIVYASLEPFSGWMAPLPNTPFFLFEPWPQYVTRFDIIVNVLAYVPFGFLLALDRSRAAGRRRGWRQRSAPALLLSFAMESTQMFLPTRDASSVDVLSNCIGATLGGLAALAFNRVPGLRVHIARWRYRAFLGGPSGDLGLALLGVWLLSQVNPGIPLFAATFDPSLELARDLAGTLLQAAQSAFNVIGVGLFLGLLLRQRRAARCRRAGAGRHRARAQGSSPPRCCSNRRHGCSGSSRAHRSALRPAHWFLCSRSGCHDRCARPYARLPCCPPWWHRCWSRTCGGRAHRLRCSTGRTASLLNFNRLTHAVLVIWPVLASTYLLWLAGQPGWGQRVGQGDASDRV